MNSSRRLVILVYAAILCYLAGILLPFIKIQPGAKLEPASGFAVWLMTDDGDMNQTVLSGIKKVGQDDFWLAVIIFAFSVVFPVAKLTLLAFLAHSRWTVSHRVMSTLKLVGPWSMVDVFVVSFFIAWLKGMPGGTIVTVAPGCFFFTASVVLTMFAGGLLNRGKVDSCPHCGRVLSAKPDVVRVSQ